MKMVLNLCLEVENYCSGVSTDEIGVRVIDFIERYQLNRGVDFT